MNRPLLSRSIFIKDHIITWYRYLVKKTYSVVRILLALEIWVLTIKVMPMRWMKDFTIDGAFFILLLLLPNYIHLDIVENLLPIFFFKWIETIAFLIGISVLKTFKQRVTYFWIDQPLEGIKDYSYIKSLLNDTDPLSIEFLKKNGIWLLSSKMIVKARHVEL